jgi:hypothetical protein
MDTLSSGCRSSKIYGFDEDRGTILKSPAVIQELNRIFDEAE